jgi:type VI secretion system secreted protein VgrG
MADVLILRSDSLPDAARVIGFRGTEALSRPYVFEVFLQIGGAEAHDFDLGGAVGATAALVVSRDDSREPFVFAGVFSEVSLLHETEDHAVLRALLVPKLERLSWSLHSRVFTGRSVPEIIEAVLRENGFSSRDYALRVSSQYKPEEHVCQYKESDLDFLSRWMEREGLYYFFEHAEDGETLIIADNKATHKDLVPLAVRYFPQGERDVTAGEHLDSFVCRHRQLPASVRYKDHDYARPTLAVAGSAAVSSSGIGEISLHGARLFTPDAAKRLASLRAEGLKSRERLFSGGGTVLYLRSGYTFSLTDHPRTAFDTAYLAVEVEHQGNQMAGAADLRRLTGLDDGGVYRVHVTAIPADVQFRAEERTPWPRIYGTEHGTVDGEADSEYAQIDEHGRYLVRFAFDESGLGDGKASTWVRMMQPHGGGIEGWHFPLRKGTEVLFTFLGGDPDRPVVAGVVPNALTPSPVTRANHTRNVIQTGGRNRIEMEDKSGYERITISTPHQESYVRMGAPNADHSMIIKTNGPTLLHAGQDLDVEVGVDKHETVRGATWEHYMSTKTEEVPNGQVTETYKAQDTTVINLRKEKIGQHEVLVEGGRLEAVHGPLVQLFASTTQRTSRGIVDEKNLSVTKQYFGANVFQTINGDLNQTITGSLSQTITSPAIETRIADFVGLKLARSNEVILGVKSEHVVGAKIESVLGTHMKLRAAPEILVGVTLIQNAQGMIENIGSKIATAAGPIVRAAAVALNRAGVTVID